MRVMSLRQGEVVHVGIEVDIAARAVMLEMTCPLSELHL